MACVKKAVILFSGGLDSSTVLAYAQSLGFDCYCLSFSYGQRHCAELEFAKQFAKHQGVAEHRIFTLDLSQFAGSALTCPEQDIPDYQEGEEVPVTYVPARNTVFLSIALAWAEVLGARDLFLGVSHVDYSGYPDCRPDFIEAFQQVANLGTQAGRQNNGLRLHTPLIELSKAETIQLGVSLGVDYAATVSCYQADEAGRACGRCDSCVLRKKGFSEAGVADPTAYQSD